MNWYYADNGRQVGPFDDTAFQNLVATGQVQPATLVWNSAMSDWKPASEAGIGVAVAEGSAAKCSECGLINPTGEMIQFGADWVCANCKDRFTQKLREGVNLSTRRTYGGFWIRVGASLIDSIITTIVVWVIIGAAFGASLFNPDSMAGMSTSFLIALWPAQFAMVAAYYIVSTSRFGGTAGKLAVGLRVIDLQGRNLTMAHCTGRYFGSILSGLTIGIGYLMAAFDDEKRTLHDRICNTRVVKK